MHNNFLDKRRRNLRLQPDQVELVLPEHFQASYPKFIAILNAYYEFQQDEKATELLHHLFAARDITETDIELLSYIENELLLGDSYFESFATGDAAKRAAANFSNTLFRSKGTKFAIQWFFRSFFGIDAEIVETKEQIFKVGDTNSTLGPTSRRFLTDDKLYQTFAYLVRSSVPISEWRELFKLFVHPAGMYLGGELLVTDTELLLFASQDSDNITDTFESIQWAFGTFAPVDVARAEGVNFTYNVNATNAPYDTTLNTTLSYVIDVSNPNDSASFADFAYSADSAFPDSDAPRFFDITNGSGSFIIPHKEDSDETEGLDGGREYYTVRVFDPEQREILKYRNNVFDVDTTFDLTVHQNNDFTVEDTLMDEGDSVQCRVVGTGVPNGRLNMFYQIYPFQGVGPVGPIDSDDFIAGFENALDPNTRQAFEIVNDSARFSIASRFDFDNTEANGETFKVLLFTEGGIFKGAFPDDTPQSVITVNDFDPTIAISSVDIREGSDVTATITVDPQTVGQQVTWTINATDDRLAATTGNLILTGTNDEYVLTGTTANDTFNGTVNETIEVATSAGIYASEISSSLESFILRDNTEQLISVSPDSAGMRGGRNVTFTVVATNAPDNYGHLDSVQWYIDLPAGGAVASDFSPTITELSEGTAGSLSFFDNSDSITLLLTDDGDTTEDAFDFVVFNDNGDSVRVSNTILGTTTYTLTSDIDEVSEGADVTFTFTPSVTSPAQNYYVSTTGTVANLPSGGADDTSSDDLDYTWQGNATAPETDVGFTVDGGAETFTIFHRSDQRREGVETYTVNISKTVGGPSLASKTITVNDTSLPQYSVVCNDLVEGNTLTATVTPDGGNSGSETLYVTFSGSATLENRIVTLQPAPQVVSTSAVDFTSSTSVDSLFNGSETGTVTVRVGSYTGTIVATTTFNMTDALPNATLTTDQTNDSANEGDTIQFSFSGSNLETQTYYYHLTDIIPKATDQSIGANTNTLFLTNTTNLTFGMEVRGIDFPQGATINAISAGAYVVMDQANTETSSTPSGTELHFALPEVFADFDSVTNPPFGSFSHTSNTTSTFDLTVEDDDDNAGLGTEETYTMRVTDGFDETQSSVDIVKDKLFTINDQTASIAGATVQFIDASATGTGGFTDPIKLTDGETISHTGDTSNFINVSASEGYAAFNIYTRREGYGTILGQEMITQEGSISAGGLKYRGDWLDPANVDSSDNYQIRATLLSSTGTNKYSNNFASSWTTLDSAGIAQFWKVSPTPPTAAGTNTASETIKFELREFKDGAVVAGNNDEITLTLTASTEYVEPETFSIFSIGSIDINFGT